ncbi:hypothetical protein AAF712_003995 [Marasmius tenuissimus]|uniref:DUF6697 domain-containing protein n=1 Tax=Marasmius tenuissimus TaxID=585030 RepID=A0ABR3A4W5_9AGAR
MASTSKGVTVLGPIKKEEEFDDAASNILKIPRNSEIVVKKQLQDIDLLPPSAIQALLQGLRTFELLLKGGDVNIMEHFSRAIIGSLYGGNNQKAFPQLSENNLRRLEADGLAPDQYACFKCDYNPLVPSIPGTPGLCFAGRELEDDLTPVETWNKGICRVFAGLAEGKWIYVGSYEISYGKTLSTQDWLNLPRVVQNEWTKSICGKNQRRRHHRVRIFLRNRPGCDRQFSAEEYLKMMDSGEDRAVTHEQVADAFARGEEAIIAWKMQCVRYEEEFQRKLIDAAAQSEKKPTHSADPDDGYTDQTSSKKTTKTKRKRAAEKSGQEEPKKKVAKTRKAANRAGSQSDDKPEYIPRGTKSRSRAA